MYVENGIMSIKIDTMCDNLLIFMRYKTRKGNVHIKTGTPKDT